MEQRVNFTMLDLASNWTSKKDLDSMPVREGGIYLPPNQEATQKYLRDLMMGRRNSLDIKIFYLLKFFNTKDDSQKHYWVCT